MELIDALSTLAGFTGIVAIFANSREKLAWHCASALPIF